jgi:hypothetical protein
VDPASYESLLNALKSRKPEDFEKIILGGTAKLADPPGPLTTALEDQPVGNSPGGNPGQR